MLTERSRIMPKAATRIIILISVFSNLDAPSVELANDNLPNSELETR
jgi:hypothetical protein